MDAIYTVISESFSLSENNNIFTLSDNSSNSKQYAIYSRLK